MREEFVDVILVPAHEETTLRTKVTCAGCGKPLGYLYEGGADNDINHLAVALNEDDCVNLFRERDYCTPCVTPIWDTINKLIGADPDVERENEDAEDSHS